MNGAGFSEIPLDDDPDVGGTNGGSQGGAQGGPQPPSPQPETKRPLPVHAYVARPFSEIPRRQWLHAGHYIRKQIVMTVAPGGYGKTALVLLNAIEMVTGRGLIGPKPVGGALRVLYWNGEDPEDEVERRIAAICIHYNIKPETLE